MENPIEQLITSAKNIRFPAGVSERIRERLVAHMYEHPMSVRSPYQHFFVRSPLMAVLTLLLLVGLGGATTYAAADALPGDPLYPVKVGMIEPVRGLLALSPEAKAVVNVSIAETRASEVVQLAAKNKLTPENGISFKEDFDHSLRAARTTLKKLSEENPDAADKLEKSLTASLDEHETALNSFAATASTTNTGEAQTLADHIKNKVHGEVQGASDEKGHSGKSKKLTGTADEIQSSATSTASENTPSAEGDANRSTGEGN